MTRVDAIDLAEVRHTAAEGSKVGRPEWSGAYRDIFEPPRLRAAPQDKVGVWARPKLGAEALDFRSPLR